MSDKQPVLLLDIDGVICPWGDQVAEHYDRMHYGDGEWDWISMYNGRRLLELLDTYEIVWASLRDEASNLIGRMHHLPPLKFINFGTDNLTPGRASLRVPLTRYRGQTWKMPWIGSWDLMNMDRPTLWIDDDLRDDAYEWADLRNESGTPTKLILTDSMVGITDAHFDEICAWGDEMRSLQQADAE